MPHIPLRKTQASPSLQNWRTCVGLTCPRACQVAMTRMTSQGSLVWNAHIPNWGATFSSGNMAIWMITESGRNINNLSNIFDCSWLHSNLFLDCFSEVHTCPTLNARDIWMLILLHADLAPKNSFPLNQLVHHFPKQIDHKLRYTMVYSTSNTSPWHLLPHLPPTRGQGGQCCSSNRQGCRLTLRCLEFRHVSNEQNSQVINHRTD